MKAKQMKKPKQTARRFAVLPALGLAFVFGFFAGPTAHAQPAPQPQTPAGTDASGNAPAESASAEAPSAADTATKATTGSQRRSAGDKGGVFRPSEDISEDIAITFPVDI